MKYADLLIEWLSELGYTHCFLVAGGNSMHLLDRARTAMTCIPFVHEVAAGIAAEYFNEAGPSDERAFVLVTAGPGLTNVLTAMAGAYLESRELLVIGGQVKSTDLAQGELRQRGIQEIDGVALARPVSVVAERIEAPIDRTAFTRLVEAGRTGRPGPVFIEVCLDAQGAPVHRADLDSASSPATVGAVPMPRADEATLARLHELMCQAVRPVWLLGGGVQRSVAQALSTTLGALGVPIMTTWNGADRLGADHPSYFGRPNTWGQRSSNVLLQQADLVVVFGSRLGLQQTGFNWQQFVPQGKVVQIDIDEAELRKGHPRVDLPIHADAGDVLTRLSALDFPSHGEWVTFCRKVREALPLSESANVTGEGYLNPYDVVLDLSEIMTSSDIMIACSSGGAFTVTLQAFEQKAGQIMITDKGLASMGYGLSGAIGAALAHPGRRTILIEGDGGFSQNLQELATVEVNRLPIKTFLFSNEGYASIRMTQRNYFGGQYLGCDTASGLGFPNWTRLFEAYAIPSIVLEPDFHSNSSFLKMFESLNPAAFIVPIDPEQSYFPKISSRVTVTGSMESNPLHLMSPDLSSEEDWVFHYLT